MTIVFLRKKHKQFRRLYGTWKKERIIPEGHSFTQKNTSVHLRRRCQTVEKLFQVTKTHAHRGAKPGVSPVVSSATSGVSRGTGSPWKRVEKLRHAHTSVHLRRRCENTGVLKRSMEDQSSRITGTTPEAVISRHK